MAACCAAILFSGCQQLRIPFAKQQPESNHVSKAAAADVQLAMAQSLEKIGETKQAISAYRKLADEKKLAGAMHRLGVLYDQQEEFAKAEANYRRAQKLMPENAELCCDLGYSYYLQEKWSESESQLRKAIEIDPQLERAHNNLGLLLARLDRRSESMIAFRKGADNENLAVRNFNFVFGKSSVQPVDFQSADQKTAEVPHTNHATVAPIQRPSKMTASVESVVDVSRVEVAPMRLGGSIESTSIDNALGIDSQPPAGFSYSTKEQSRNSAEFVKYLEKIDLLGAEKGTAQVK